MTRFKDLAIGDKFDWINDEQPTFNSFYGRCKKISTRKYRAIGSGHTYTVGTVKATVYHVEPRT